MEHNYGLSIVIPRETYVADLRIRLRQAMKKAKLNQRQLAAELKTTESAVSQWFKKTMPKHRTLEEIAKLTGVSAEWLIGYEQLGRDLIRQAGLSIAEPPAVATGGLSADDQKVLLGVVTGMRGATAALEEWIRGHALRQAAPMVAPKRKSG